MKPSTPDTPATGHLRPYQFRKDLRAISDLIELCFDKTLDPDGRRYLKRMRLVAQHTGTRFYSSLMLSNTSIPTTGFVWETGGKIVGNLSMVPFYDGAKRFYLIANVAVHPDFRRRGIARAMTSAAIRKVKQLGYKELWLQVREDNPGACRLYDSLGFEVIKRRNTWLLSPGKLSGKQPVSRSGEKVPRLRIVPHRPQYWKQHLAWLDVNYPENIRWHMPIRISSMQPGLLGNIRRLLGDVTIRQWCVANQTHLLGILTWQSSRSHADHLWLAAPPESILPVLKTGLSVMAKDIRITRPMLLTFPAGIAEESFTNAGFIKQQTLLWMRKSFL